MMNQWEDDINAFHLSLADGKLSEMATIEMLSIREYYAYLQANKDRNEKMKKEIEDAKKELSKK